MTIPYYFSVLAAFGLTVFLLILLRKVAFDIGLVDKPNARKTHEGVVPLTGGLAMFIALSISLLTLDISLGWLRAFLGGAVVLVLTGVLDDLHELSTTSRFVAQIIAALIMSVFGGMALVDFGHLISTSFVFETGWLAIPVTVFASIGVINALNMLDGINGLAGSVTLVSISGIAIVSVGGPHPGSLLVLGLLAAVLVGFLLFNLRCDKKNCSLAFMGDAGSMFLGFVLSWFFIMVSQGDDRAMAPVTALWLFAIPLNETLTMMLRRVRQGRSPFDADREHIHHLFEKAGFSKRFTLLAIVLAAVLFAGIGLTGHFMGIAEPLMFYGFLGVFAGYLAFIRWGWRVLATRD